MQLKIIRFFRDSQLVKWLDCYMGKWPRIAYLYCISYSKHNEMTNSEIYMWKK